MELGDLPQPTRVDTVSPDELEVDGDNPNEQTEEMFGLLCENIRSKGWIGNHIIADEDGLIADGEHRWRAAQEIGLSEVPVKFYDIDDAERRLWRQELNKISGEHDSKRDALEYDYLLDSGKSEEVTDLVDATGEDLDELLAEIRVDNTKPVGYEYDPEHNVWFEDCVEGMRERLEDDSVDMVFTSPPYNISLGASEDEHLERSGRTYYEDERSDAEFREFITEVLEQIDRVLKPNGHLFWNTQIDHGGGIEFPGWVLRSCPVPAQSLIVWDKENTSRAGISMNPGRYKPVWEPIFHFSHEPRPLSGRKNWDVWHIPNSSAEREHDTGEHPAPYPVALVGRAIEESTTEGDRVLDPFMGSGTTAVAAIQNDRDYVGFELDEEGAYKPIIERRIGEAKRQTQAMENQG